jgi:hypothetical protein
VRLRNSTGFYSIEERGDEVVLTFIFTGNFAPRFMALKNYREHMKEETKLFFNLFYIPL